MRIAPQLVGMGLIEAIPEAQTLALADPEDSDGDGISGRIRIVSDVVTGDSRLGRFGWKAGQPTVKQQSAAALRTDMGVLTQVYPTPDCGSAQADCGSSGAELDEQDLDDLTRYISLLGVAPQDKNDDENVLAGELVFGQIGCEAHLLWEQHRASQREQDKPNRQCPWHAGCLFGDTRRQARFHPLLRERRGSVHDCATLRNSEVALDATY